MKLEYYGHSFWRLVTDNLKVVIDPFDDIGYPIPHNLEADYVIISHEHHDHNNIAILKGNPLIIKTPGVYSYPNLIATLISVFHDDKDGARRGKNNIIRLEIDGLTLVHCGDLGHIPEQKIIEQLYQPDMLLVPVGEIFTLTLPEVETLINKLNPKLVFPMHYQTSALGFKLGSPESFLQGKSHIIRHNTNTLEITQDLLSQRNNIIMNWAVKG